MTTATATPVNNITFDFLTAGKAEFTVFSNTGEHYTYQVFEREFKDHKYFAVRVLVATDKYAYLGVMRKEGLCTTGASEFKMDDIRCQVFNWAHKKLKRGSVIPEGYGIIHVGKCCKCHRKLTNQASILSGIGPECAKKGK